MPALIRARLATRILLSGWRALFPDNRDYILRSNHCRHWLIWGLASGLARRSACAPCRSVRGGRGQDEL